MRAEGGLISCSHRVLKFNPEQRQYAIGAEIHHDETSFRVWSPDESTLEIVFRRGDKLAEPCFHKMTRTDDGYFELSLAEVKPFDRYGFKFADDEKFYPDPASRSQPEGPHGLSQVVSDEFAWSDSDFQGPDPIYQIIYELHVGTFTEAGTFLAAAAQLDELKNIGVTTIELMPVAEFSGEFGWGYDGVQLFAPYHVYGTSHDLKTFIDAAHALGIAVILDVVYNHFGGDGNYAPRFSTHYLTDRHANEWGDAINFDGENCAPVREFFLTNARYWHETFHFDGLRLDATQQIFDSSSPHIIEEIVATTRGAKGSTTFLVGENEPQLVELITNYGLDALWNDDFHHTARVALTGKREGYFADYLGAPQEFVSSAKHGFLYQGQVSQCRGKSHGTQTGGLKRFNFVTFIENHDQVANSGRGERLYETCDRRSYKAVLALLLLGPGTPMLFQGQEFASSAPFGYFADHRPPLSDLVCAGRLDSLKKFRSLNNDSMFASIKRPDDQQFFLSCKIDHNERETNAEMYAYTKRLLSIRASLSVYREDNVTVEGAVLSAEAFCLRLEGADSTLLILTNLGHDLRLSPCAEPLLADRPASRWSRLFSSEDPEYGGFGCSDVLTGSDIYLPARSSVVFKAETRL